MRKSISVEEAQMLLLKYTEKTNESEEILLLDASGRVLAEDIYADHDQPPFSRSPLDGYAVRGKETLSASEDEPVRLKIIGTVYAGYVFTGRVGPGQAVRIMTGAPIPDGADTVIRQEDTDYKKTGSSPEYVEIYKGSKPYRNYCFRGEDYKSGQLLLHRGMLLHAGEIAILASLGMDHVTVYKLPQIAVFSSGDEILEPDDTDALLPGTIYDSNRYYLTARLTELGIRPVISEHVMDNAEEMAEKIRKAGESCRLIITTGAVSVGEKDIMHEVERILPAKHIFWSIKLKPGAPTLAFLYNNTLVICLAGNPFGAIVNLDLLVRPVLAKMTGNPHMGLKKRRARLTEAYRKPRGSRRFLRGHFDGENVSLTSSNQMSGAIASLAGCNCFIETSPENEGAEEGELVWIYLL